MAGFTAAFGACALGGFQVPAQRPALSSAPSHSLAPAPQEPSADKHPDKSPDFPGTSQLWCQALTAAEV